jgi:hypothetical protein
LVSIAAGESPLQGVAIQWPIPACYPMYQPKRVRSSDEVFRGSFRQFDGRRVYEKITTKQMGRMLATRQGFDVYLNFRTRTFYGHLLVDSVRKV